MFEEISLLQVVLMAVVIGVTYFVYERIIKPYTTYLFYQKVLGENYRT